jgi:hypothetical protein
MSTNLVVELAPRLASIGLDSTTLSLEVDWDLDGIYVFPPFTDFPTNVLVA